MIVYLATYPRSGNSRLQAFIAHNFCFLTTQVRRGGVKPIEAAPEWDLQPVPPCELWLDRLATYRRHATPGPPVSFDPQARWRYLQPGPAPSLALRELLAAEAHPFFIKTHDPPFDRYLPGERVIRVTRHPGPTLWSYFRYLTDVLLGRASDRMFEAPPNTVEGLIEGHGPAGDWSDFHRTWDASSERLGKDCFHLRYEDMDRSSEILESISRFIGYPVERHEPRAFEEYVRRFPGKGLRGTSDQYEQFYTRPQLGRLWDRHGSLAQAYGYSAPDPTHAIGDDQIARLGVMIEEAWRRGRQFDEARRKLIQRLEGPAARVTSKTASD